MLIRVENPVHVPHGLVHIAKETLTIIFSGLA